MSSWQRITLVAFALIGGTASFGYWSINQFDNAFDNLSASSVSVANTLRVSSFATSTDETILVLTSTTTATTTTATATSTDTDVGLSFTFPQEGDEAYSGCTYQISWQSSTPIGSLEAALIDAGTRESVGPIASGLAKENTIERDIQTLQWKVGVVWPGAYYINVSKINGVAAEFRSGAFQINTRPEGFDEKEKNSSCPELSE